MVTRKPILSDTQYLTLTNTSNFSDNNLISSISDSTFKILRAGFESGEVLSFPLGSELPIAARPDDVNWCYLICSGRVRLLHEDRHLHRQRSVTVLEAGEVFGVDHLLHDRTLPYRVVAASPCYLIQLPFDQLSVLFDNYPFLRPYLQQKAQERERLVFFKGFTPLRSHPGEKLKHVLLPQLTEQIVPASTPLSHQVGDRPCQVWLRSGKILSSGDSSAAPRMGDSWYEDAPATDGWIAATDVLLYKRLP
ncbi:MAG: Crp/Fnr family transcriptional regulator [Synechococcales bacterium]|nr:Crp/Fnr family transcriptional regulator [Synechococcales bacterium]